MDHHRLSEERSIALHGRIAERLREAPELVAVARARVADWALTGEVDSRYAAGWAQVLSLPLDELCGVLVDPSERARALRQVSPFAGVLSPRDRWRIRRQVLLRQAPR